MMTLSAVNRDRQKRFLIDNYEANDGVMVQK